MPQARYTNPVRMCQSAKVPDARLAAESGTSCLVTPLELTVVSSFILDTSQYHAKPKFDRATILFCGHVGAWYSRHKHYY